MRKWNVESGGVKQGCKLIPIAWCAYWNRGPVDVQFACFSPD